MLTLLLSLFATSGGGPGTSAAACLRPDSIRTFCAARMAPVPGARHEDQAASRRVHVPVAAAIEGFLQSPERRACALYLPPSLAHLTPSATPSSQRDPPAIG